MKEQELLTQLDSLGLHTQEALGRFMGNQALFLSFVRQLPEKLNFSRIRQQLEAEDEEDFYMNIHNLKGLSGNLSIEPFMNVPKPSWQNFAPPNLKIKRSCVPCFRRRR